MSMIFFWLLGRHSVFIGYFVILLLLLLAVLAVVAALAPVCKSGIGVIVYDSTDLFAM